MPKIQISTNRKITTKTIQTKKPTHQHLKYWGYGHIGQPRKYPWIEMDVNDSFLFKKSISPRTTIANVSKASVKYHPKKFVARKLDNGRIACFRVA